ncbi:MAG TPA: GGDEF domain-containing protein [Alphaproteobacteria bacterium]|nr:GGDEF domain-containing protein [Alphaproteobacteria bacterium]
MKIGESKPVRDTQPVRTGSSRAQQTDGATQGRVISDNTTIMGIPETELTPKVRDAIMALMQELDRFRQELDVAKKRIAHLETIADQDTLTGILNRRGFVGAMNRVKSYADRYDTPASLVYFDLNKFKPVNDLYGHAAGDEVLRRIAEILTQNTRDSDVVGRLGGDEFGVILVNSDLPTAEAKAKQLAEAISAESYNFDGKTEHVHAAYGVYTFIKGEGLDETLAKADKKMFAAKQASNSAR